MSTKNLWKKYHYEGAILVLLMVQIIVMIHFGNEKRSFHTDEIATLQLSNSYFQPFLPTTEFVGQWKNKEDFIERITVQPGERFAYSSVYYNQSKDVHPPFYYFLINTISSFYVDTYSKWLGISVNILFFILCNLLLIKLSNRLIQNKWLAIAPSFSWGFSAGAISTVIFIRMYMVLTFFVLCFTYLLSKIMFEKKTGVMDFISLSAVTFLGFMTHYYFLVYIFFLSCGFGIFLLIKKRWKHLVGFCGAVLTGLGLGIAFFPASIAHIFSGYRGKQALEGLSNGLTSLLKDYDLVLKIINEQLFWGIFQWLLVALLVLFLYVAIQTTLGRYKTNKLGLNQSRSVSSVPDPSTGLLSLPTPKYFLGFILFFAVLFYFLLITKIAPYKTDRYFFCIYPLVILMFYLLILTLIGKFSLNKNVFTCAFFVIILVASFLSYKSGSINYLYKNVNLSSLEKIRNYSTIDCYFFYDSKNESFYLKTYGLVQMLNHNKCFITDVNSGLAKTISDISSSTKQEIIIYILKKGSLRELDNMQILTPLLMETRFSSYKQILEAGESGTHTSGYLVK